MCTHTLLVIMLLAYWLKYSAIFGMFAIVL